MATQTVAKVVAISAPQPALEIASWGLDPAVLKIIDHSEEWQQAAYRCTKRAIDVLIALIALIAGVPVFLAVAVAIKLNSPGPVFFAHHRLGRTGKTFSCYKFRTMVKNAEACLQSSPELRKEFEISYKLKSDPRVTPVGHWLRRFSVDELPQFWNVLKGDMALIGPRPIVLAELDHYGRHGTKLLSVRPGLSGLWQTCGRSDTSYEHRVRLDMLYIDRVSIVLDLVLLLRTIPVVFKRAGAC